MIKINENLEKMSSVSLKKFVTPTQPISYRVMLGNNSSFAEMKNYRFHSQLISRKISFFSGEPIENAHCLTGI